MPKAPATSSGSACSTACRASGEDRQHGVAPGLWRGRRGDRHAADRRQPRPDPRPAARSPQTSLILRITTAAGALVLVHNLYGQAAPASRSHIRLAMLGLRLDVDLRPQSLHHGLSRRAERRRCSSGAGVAVALTAPLFALGARNERRLAHPPVARGDLPVALAARDLRLFRADGDPRHRASRIGRSTGRRALMVARARGHDRRRDGR